MQLLWHRAPRSGDRSGLSTAHTHTKCQDSRMMTKTVPTHRTQNWDQNSLKKIFSIKIIQDTRAAALRHLHCHNGCMTHQSKSMNWGFCLFPQNQWKIKAWALIGKMFECNAWSIHLRENLVSSCENNLWPERNSWDIIETIIQHRSLQVIPPHTPWCQQVYLKADDSSLGNKHC